MLLISLGGCGGGTNNNDSTSPSEPTPIPSPEPEPTPTPSPQPTVTEKPFNTEANIFLADPRRDPAITFKRLSIITPALKYIKYMLK